MAFVTKFEEDDREVRSMHPTKVICKYIVSENQGKKIIQLNTYGSLERDFPDKLSQTLQLDETTARQLKDILVREF
ncbi:MAG: hypothetical protein AAF922_14450 [Pseudomonadota bacterium]